MGYLLYVFRFFYRIRWWLVIVPPLIAMFVYFGTGTFNRTYLPRTYKVSTTIYTGVISGYNIESDAQTGPDWNAKNSALDNLINLITSEVTLKRVSIRLYARNMVNGDVDKDNNFIQASSYRALLAISGDVLDLIDKSSEEKTIANLLAYERPDNKNFIYGLFYWSHPHYSLSVLKEKLKVNRMGYSDMLEIAYEADDPGIAYNTLAILNDEFIFQYQDLRFGETNNVILYFEEELARVGKKLRIAEDSLTVFNVEKGVINYLDQTKEVAAMNTDFELKYQEIQLNYNSAKAVVQNLESRLDDYIKGLRSNSEFMNKLHTISNLTAQIATYESFQKTDQEQESPDIENYRKNLERAENDLTSFSGSLSVFKNTKEGIVSSDLVVQWLEQVIKLEKATAELKVIEKRKAEITDKYLYYAPIGSVLKRKERDIDFSERTYLSILSSLNAARLRQKNLQMTSATLKIMNPPIFPIAPELTKRKLMVVGAFFGSILFLVGYFLLLDLIDRTLRDKTRTERLTGGKVLGAYPGEQLLRYRRYYKTCCGMAIQYLGNALFHHFGSDKPVVINLISTESGDGKSYIAERLATQWRENGLKVKVLSWNRDFSVVSKAYLFAEDLKSLYCVQDEDVLIVEYPPLRKYSVPDRLVQGCNVNLLIARANRGWKDTDQLLFDQLVGVSGETPVFIYLNRARRDVVEEFTGLLPPYTRLRRLSYRLSQLGLTEVNENNSRSDELETEGV